MVWPAKPKIFTIWLFTKKVCQPLNWGVMRFQVCGWCGKAWLTISGWHPSLWLKYCLRSLLKAHRPICQPSGRATDRDFSLSRETFCWMCRWTLVTSLSQLKIANFYVSGIEGRLYWQAKCPASPWGICRIVEISNILLVLSILWWQYRWVVFMLLLRAQSSVCICDSTYRVTWLCCLHLSHSSTHGGCCLPNLLGSFPRVTQQRRTETGAKTGVFTAGPVRGLWPNGFWQCHLVRQPTCAYQMSPCLGPLLQLRIWSHYRLLYDKATKKIMIYFANIL